ncbi:MAG: glycoside hydrolase family 127 protein [Bacteroidales bacterium]|nr:glycoside hydrolase family 127 protein [Bacteroidales bacterium]
MKRLLSVFFILSGVLANAQVFNRAPLEPSRYANLPLGTVRADGWLQEQLERQAAGLTGNLDKVYPEVVGQDNAWLGGDGDAWERGPYWLDGLLPLAYILQDQSLIDKAQTWVEAILASQQPDGYMGPSTDHPFVYGLQRGQTHDWWPKMVVLKIIRQYYEATEDSRALSFLKAYFRYQAAHLGETPLDHWTDWGRWRGADNLDVAYWLYNLTGESWLLELGERLHSQTTDWTSLFLSGDIFVRQGSVHCVNLAQGFKAPLVWWQYSHDESDREAPSVAARTISHTVGIPNGLWAGDEMLHFGSPSRGSELCTAVEMMFSLETMLRISGDVRWADWLERVAYNALPTQVNDDYSARQYFQQTNQVACTREWRPFSTPHDDTDNLFGTLNGYPCCLCNMHQGWPKFVQNLWYSSADGGLAALVYAPSTVTAKVAGGISVTVRETTDYPFDGTVTFTIEYPDRGVRKAGFPLYLRIPSWCGNASLELNGQPFEASTGNGILGINRVWKKGDVLRIQFPMDIRTEEGWDKAWSILRGPLVYALKMQEDWKWLDFEGKDRHYGNGAWEVTSDSPWNYCLMRDSFHTDSCVVVSRPVKGYPWNLANAPVHITVPARTLPHWKAQNGSVGEIPYWTETGDDTGEVCRIELIPYGCTTLRIAAFPTRIIPWDKALREELL